MGLLDTHAPEWLPIDPISGNRLIIEPVHGAIHDGVHFTANHNKLLGSGSTLSMMITTPVTTASKYIHFVCGVECSKAATWTLSECSASVGSAYTAYNNNRNSAITDPATIALNPTITTYGTILETHTIGTSGNPNSVSGGGVEQRNEWLLAPAKQYLVNVTTYAASSDTVINMPYYYRE